jgi:aldose 1-epimerase
MILKRSFGRTASGIETFLYEIKNTAGASVSVTDYGARIVSINVPDRDGKVRDVLLGCDKVSDYEEDDAFLGASVGRVANRTSGSEFTLNGQKYHLNSNSPGGHTLHGGLRGFDKAVWELDTCTEDSLSFTLSSPNMEEGYPGKLDVKCTFTWTDNKELRVSYEAVTDRDTPVNLTGHGYFNLAGHDSDISASEQILTINADFITPTDENLIPTGEIRPVAGTAFDFRKAKRIGRDIDSDDIQLRFGKGFDHNWVLNKTEHGEYKLAARLFSPDSGITMEMYTDQPGLQFYAGNALHGQCGKGGVHYGARQGAAFEAQNFPNAANMAHFPSPILRPGEKYCHRTAYKFY